MSFRSGGGYKNGDAHPFVESVFNTVVYKLTFRFLVCALPGQDVFYALPLKTGCFLKNTTPQNVISQQETNE
jgi:hypothetical protein